jgi:hypothetical protein
MKPRQRPPTASQRHCGGEGSRLPAAAMRISITAPDEDAISLEERRRLHVETCPICASETARPARSHPER